MNAICANNGKEGRKKRKKINKKDEGNLFCKLLMCGGRVGGVNPGPPPNTVAIVHFSKSKLSLLPPFIFPSAYSLRPFLFLFLFFFFRPFVWAGWCGRGSAGRRWRGAWQHPKIRVRHKTHTVKHKTHTQTHTPTNVQGSLPPLKEWCGGKSPCLASITIKTPLLLALLM